MSETSQKNHISHTDIQEKSFWTITKRFLEPVKKTPWLSLGSFFLVFTKAGGNLGSAYIVSQIIFGIESADRDIFMSNLHIYVGLMIFIRLFNFFISRVLRRYHFDEMRVDIYKEALHTYTLLSNNRAEGIGTGRANSIIQKGCDRWIEMINTVFTDFALTFVVVLSILIYAYIDLGIYGFMGFVGIWVIGICISRYGNTIVQSIRRERKEFVTKADRRIVRYIMSKFEILLSGKTDEELSIVDHIFKKLQEIGLRISIKEIFAVDVSYIVTAVIACFWLRYAGDAIIAGTMGFATFTLWWMLFGRMRGNIERATYALTGRYRNRTHVEKLREFLDTDDYIVGYDTGDTFSYQKGNIELKDISFGYNKSPTPLSRGNKSIEKKEGTIFKKFSLHIPGGKKTALVGPSGSGKSTLVKLIAGYLRSESGDICIDGQSLPSNLPSPNDDDRRSGWERGLGGEGKSQNHISLKSYYSHIGYLTQEPSVFDGTIRENLEYGVQTPTPRGPFPLSRDNECGSILTRSSLIREVGSTRKEEEVGGFANNKDNALNQAIKNANCEFIYDLPHGLDTEIGERGIKLSGGQRQRLAIAKIFLKNPKIVILDEPTSALDSESEEAVTQAMKSLFEDRTVLIIAHRLQTVKHADNILYMENGQITESGTHEELIALEGKYWRMVELQSGF